MGVVGKYFAHFSLKHGNRIRPGTPLRVAGVGNEGFESFAN
jgi:hypothetical protein